MFIDNLLNNSKQTQLSLLGVPNADGVYNNFIYKDNTFKKITIENIYQPAPDFSVEGDYLGDLGGGSVVVQIYFQDSLGGNLCERILDNKVLNKDENISVDIPSSARKYIRVQMSGTRSPDSNETEESFVKVTFE